MMTKTWIAGILFLFFVKSPAQIKKFGKISKKDFVLKNPDKYKDDDAVILFKKRETWYEYDKTQGWFIITKIHERRLLKNKDGFDYGTKYIRLYGKNKEERVSVKAVTFNLVDGKIVKTKLNKKDIFRQQLSKYWFEKKFTMPNLKPGSIVDWEYKIRSPYVQNIDDIIYKIDIPIQYLEAEIRVPEFFHFKYSTTNFFPVNLIESDDVMNINFVSKHRTGGVGWTPTETHFQNNEYEVKLNVYNLKLKDIAPISKEPFMNSINNYIGRVKFELSYIKFPQEPPKFVATTWEDATKTIYFKEKFGGELKKHLYFKKDLAQLIDSSDTPDMKVIKIFNFVKNKVKWNNEYGILADDGVARAYKNGTGNVAELNFILIAMLNAAGVKAYPVLVSTNSHGIPMFPTLEGFNYVITAALSGNQIILMDPTEKYAIPGVLPKRVLNWKGRLVKKDGSSSFVDLFPKYYSISADNIQATITDELAVNGFDVKNYTGNFALQNRRKYDNKTKEDLKKTFEKKYDNLNIVNIRQSNLKKLDKVYKILFQFNMEDAADVIGNKIVLNPVLFLHEKENVFKSDKRDFPVYFGFPMMFSYDIKLKLPSGYKIEKLPENTTFSTPDGTATYSYQIKQTGDGIELVIENKISEPVIPNTQYQSLKDYFGKVVDKENEKVILSKKP